MRRYVSVTLVALAALTVGGIVRGSVPLVGCCMAAAGALIAVASRWGKGYNFALGGATGILYIAAGAPLILKPDAAPALLALLIAGFLGLQGLLRLGTVPAAGRGGRALTHAIVCFALALLTAVWALQRVVVGLILGVLTLQEWPAPGLRVIGCFVVVDMLLCAWSLTRPSRSVVLPATH